MTTNPAEVAARVLAAKAAYDERHAQSRWNMSDTVFWDEMHPAYTRLIWDSAPLLARALLEAEQREMALVVARRAWPIGALVTIPMLDAIDAIVAAHDAQTGETE